MRIKSFCLAPFALLLLAGGAFAQSAGGGATLSERLTAAVSLQEPAWRVAQPLRGILSPDHAVAGTWEGDGFEIRVSMSAHASGAEAAAVFKRDRSMAYTAMTPSPLRTAWRDYRRANVVISIVADALAPASDPAAPAFDTGGPRPASVVERVASIIDGLITGDVRVGACVNELYPDPRPAPATPLETFFRDVEDGCLPRVERALAAGAGANERDAQGHTPLARAVASGRRQVVQALLRAGADPGARVGAGGSALSRVFSRPLSYHAPDLPDMLANQLAIVDDLVAAGADLEAAGDDGRTLLLEAARMNYDDGSPEVLLKGLVERGADASARDRNGRTAVILAVMNTHPKVNLTTIPILLAAGADVNARDESGKTAADYARERAGRHPEEGWQGVLRLLTAGRGPRPGRG